MLRIISFDIIRIFACLCILIIHFNASVSGYDLFGNFVYNNGILPNTYFNGVYLGNIGVGLFFILSGASLQYSSGVITRKNLKQFYLKRIKAIYPCFWIAFFVATLVNFMWYRGMTHAAAEKIFISILGLDGYSMLIIGRGYEFYQVGEWFLGCIIIIYLFYPILSNALNSYPKLTTLIIMLMYIGGVQTFKEHWFFLQFPYFILGILYVKIFKNYPKVYLWIPTIVMIAIRIIFNDYLHPLTIAIIINWGLFLGFVSFFDEINIKSDIIKTRLAFFSDLTYPAFLVHHKLITLLAGLFNLQVFPYRYTITLFIIYMILTIYLSYKLKKAGKLLSYKLFDA